jgi:hypothetical protein
VPTGAITLIPGREGIGKSLALVWMTAKITRGELPGVHFGTPRSVIYGASEDSWQRTIVPRLIAAGTDRSRVYRVDVVTEVGRIDALSLPRDCRAVESAITHYDIALMCLDPLMSTIGAGIDTHRDRELRGALEPLVSLADRTGCVVVGLAHFNKSSGTDPLNLVSGSRAFTAVIRAAIGIARDPDADDGSCVMTQIKNNLGKLDVPSLRYVVEGAAIPTDEGPADVGVLRFIGDSDRSVYDILRDHNDRDDADRSERDDAAEWLRHWLIDQGGEAARPDVFKSGRAEGFSEATLKRARPRAGVTTERRGFGGGSVWRVDLHRPWPPSGSHSDRLAVLSRDVGQPGDGWQAADR